MKTLQPTTRQVCTFYLDKLLFGVDVAQVQEVIRYQPMTPVPLSPTAISGLINLRGHIVSALELRERLRMPPRSADDAPMNVIVRTRAGGVVSLLVDEIGDVVDVADTEREAPLTTLELPLRELIHAVYKLEGQLLLLLDADTAAGVGTTQRRAGNALEMNDSERSTQ